MTLFDAPWHDNDPDTSRTAAMKQDAAAQKRRVLEALFAAGEYGATDDEPAVAAGIQIRHAAATRRGVLVKEGKARATDRRRKSAWGNPSTVWVITTDGIDSLRGAA